MRLARWLDSQRELPEATPSLGGALRLLGLEKFRENQLEVVLAALKGESVLLVSPTGSGKTLCFQLPTLLRSGTAFIISPLKALMSDQVSGLQKKKIPSSFINGDLSPNEKHLRYELLEQQALKFLYCTPERFDTEMVRAEEVKRISRAKPNFLVVDEAHCIDRWGGDFRPNYSRLGAVKQLLGNPPILAFTATAGIKTQKRILQSLGIPNARVVVSGVDRPNIALLRLPMPNDEARFRVIKWLYEVMPAGRAMAFVPTVKVGEHLQEGLKILGSDRAVLPFQVWNPERAGHASWSIHRPHSTSGANHHLYQRLRHGARCARCEARGALAASCLRGGLSPGVWTRGTRWKTIPGGSIHRRQEGHGASGIHGKIDRPRSRIGRHAEGSRPQRQAVTNPGHTHLGYSTNPLFSPRDCSVFPRAEASAPKITSTPHRTMAFLDQGEASSIKAVL